MIQPEADPEHIATHIGDAVSGAKLLAPALRVWASEREEARVRPAVERVQKLGLREWCA